jgi:hypothetical protein
MVFAIVLEAGQLWALHRTEYIILLVIILIKINTELFE